MDANPNPEKERLLSHRQRESNWKLWGPYLSERAWGTVREDYSSDGEAWTYFPHDHARSKVYRWNEDGLGGISDRNQYLCFALALWNGKDPILKERLFGLTNLEGNHGEDVKEYYFYLDNTPTHSYMKMLYKYPQNEFPYDELVAKNKARGQLEPEYELLDTGIFDQDRYFDVFIEYAKENQEDILIKIEVVNRSDNDAFIHLLPTLWFRNTWSWGYPNGPMNDVGVKPNLQKAKGVEGSEAIAATHPVLGNYYLYAEGSPALLFTENETNCERLLQQPNSTPYVKDAFHRYVIQGDIQAVNPSQMGTKSAACYQEIIPKKGSKIFRMHLSHAIQKKPFDAFDSIFEKRKKEADTFYDNLHCPSLSLEEKAIQRQALAGMLWDKQLYYYDVEQWLKHDSSSIVESRKIGRNYDWEHLVNFDIISMPDKWEYPWYANWDLGFHSLALVMVDSDFAKRQIELMTREWYMHPNGQLPAYEWDFSDVNPPVIAWAAWWVYKRDAEQQGKCDVEFLRGIYHKLLLNFTWWVNRNDPEGHNIFQGGFLGFDNISLFNRSLVLPAGVHLYQSDSTAWMAFYCILMLRISLELAKKNPVYQDTATKFFEHFLRIGTTMVSGSEGAHALWDEEDGFFYDTLYTQDKGVIPLKLRSLVGLIPLLAIETIEPDVMQSMDIFSRRMNWFISKRPDYVSNMACIQTPGVNSRRLMSILNRDRLVRVLHCMLDENEFLSDYGIRSLSRYHQEHPFILRIQDKEFIGYYEPAEAQSRLFGGNSNWRGPIWMPLNFMIIEALYRFHQYYGEDLKVEFPTHSGNMMTLLQVANELSKRLTRLFLRNEHGKRPIYGDIKKFQEDPHWRDYLLFYEYFHGDTGLGLGASHQTGWTGLIAQLVNYCGLLQNRPSSH